MSSKKPFRECENMRVDECARLLGKSPQFVRIGLQRGILPFGYAIKMSSRYTYHISEARVHEYLGREGGRKLEEEH